MKSGCSRIALPQKDFVKPGQKRQFECTSNIYCIQLSYVIKVLDSQGGKAAVNGVTRSIGNLEIS